MSLPGNFEITLQDYGESPTEPVAVKLQSDTAELNVWLTFPDIAAISSGLPSGYHSQSLAAGTVAGSRAFWNIGDAGELFIVVGKDDETWDFGVTLSPGSRDTLLKVLETFQARLLNRQAS